MNYLDPAMTGWAVAACIWLIGMPLVSTDFYRVTLLSTLIAVLCQEVHEHLKRERENSAPAPKMGDR